MSTSRRRFKSQATDRPEKPPWAHNPWKPPADLIKITQRCIDVYLLSKNHDGGIHGIGWWQQANGYTAIALHDMHQNSRHNYDTLTTALRESNRRNNSFINEFNDDSLWWGLSSVHVHSLGREDWFVHQAKAVWQHLRSTKSIIERGQITFNGQDMEGACYWTTNPGEEQVNAITTGLFAELSVRLALDEQSTREHLCIDLKRTHPACVEYIECARRSLDWILRCRYRVNEAVVLDNILLKQQKAQDWIWSYNTGVAMGVCALLHEATGEREMLTLACTMANEAMRRSTWVEANGVLDEPAAYGKGTHDPAKNNDAVGFKSVLIRQLGTLYLVIRRISTDDIDAHETADTIQAFVNVNLQSQLERNTDGDGKYGPWWNGPFEMPTNHSQMAVLDVMAAAVLVNST